MIFFEIPLVVILAFLALIIGGVYQITSNIGMILLCLVFITIVIGILILLIRIFYKMYKGNGNRLFFINYIAIASFWIYGLLFIMDLYSLDKSNMYFKMLKHSESLSYLVPFLGVMLISLCILTIFHFYCMKRPIQSILIVVPTAFIVGFCVLSSNICTKSYSDYTVNEMNGSGTVVQYTITKNTKIYYPSDVGTRFPGVSLIKYSFETFKEGETVYINEDRYEETFWTEKRFVQASNGQKAGYISLDFE